jgi:hypothetical protein
MREEKKTPNAERRTPNIERFSDLDAGRHALGFERLLFRQIS